MHTAKLGDRVRIQYSRVARPGATNPRPAKVLEFIVGGAKVIPGLSVGVIGMNQGDHKRLRLKPAQAYGPARRSLIRAVPRGRFPEHLVLQVGRRLTALVKSTGRRRPIRVVEVKPDSVVVDGNHRLAGKAITLQVELISVDSSANANHSKPQFDLGGES